MKISKEYTLAIIAGLFLLAYVLESTVKPLTIGLASPYSFLNPTLLKTYPFTTALIIIRSIALFITPLWLWSFFNSAHYAKGGTLLVIAGLMQLYAIQELASKSKLVPMEWSLSLSLAGVALLLPTILFLIRGSIQAMHQKISSTPNPFNEDED